MVLIFRFRLYQPSASIRLIDTTGMATCRRNFNLPPADFSTFNSRTNEDTTVPVCLLLELQCQFKVFVLFVSREITIPFVVAALTDEDAIFNIPFFSTVNSPAAQVFPVKQFLVGLCKDTRCNKAE